MTSGHKVSQFVLVSGELYTDNIMMPIIPAARYSIFTHNIITIANIAILVSIFKLKFVSFDIGLNKENN